MLIYIMAFHKLTVNSQQMFKRTARSLDPDTSSCKSNLSPVRMIQSPKVSPFAIALQPLAMISLCFEGIGVSQDLGNPESTKIQLSYTSLPIGMVPDPSLDLVVLENRMP